MKYQVRILSDHGTEESFHFETKEEADAFVLGFDYAREHYKPKDVEWLDAEVDVTDEPSNVKHKVPVVNPKIQAEIDKAYATIKIMEETNRKLEALGIGISIDDDELEEQ